MLFGVESATAVPRRQRSTLSAIVLPPALRTWATSRARRGFMTTAWLFSFAVFNVPLARAQGLTTADDPPPQGAVGAASSLSFARRLAESHLQRAELLEQRGEIAQALREYTLSLEVDSTLGAAYLHLGALRERMGDPREAELIYGEALRLSDARAEALLVRARLRHATGNVAQALSDLEAAVELDPNRAALDELARAYVEQHAWGAALSVARRIAASAVRSGAPSELESARLEVRALRVLAAETDSSQAVRPKHDWVGNSLRSIANR
jgi:tetratricopeptide (TPR) repeat protein